MIRLFVRYDGRLREWVFFALGVLASIAAVAAIVGGALFTVSIIERRGCHRTADAMGREARYNGATEGCLIRTDAGTFVPLDNYRLSNTEAGR